VCECGRALNNLNTLPGREGVIETALRHLMRLLLIFCAEIVEIELFMWALAIAVWWLDLMAERSGVH